MKLLFDQNLSFSLVRRLEDLFPESVHVGRLKLAEADDEAVWKYACENGYAIVSKDSDFQQRSLLLGSPPKLIWIRIGNSTTGEIEQLVRKHSVSIHTFDADPTQAMLVLSG